MKRKNILLLKIILIMLLPLYLTGCINTSELTTPTGPSGNYKGNNSVVLDGKLYYNSDTLVQKISLDDARKYCEDRDYAYLGEVSKMTDAKPKNDFESALSPEGSLLYQDPNSEDDSVILYDLSETSVFKMTHFNDSDLDEEPESESVPVN